MQSPIAYHQSVGDSPGYSQITYHSDIAPMMRPYPYHAPRMPPSPYLEVYTGHGAPCTTPSVTSQDEYPVRDTSTLAPTSIHSSFAETPFTYDSSMLPTPESVSSTLSNALPAAIAFSSSGHAAHRLSKSPCYLNGKPEMPIIHPYARLYTKKHSNMKRRKMWNHALEKLIFTPQEISAMSAPARRQIYLASLEAHIDRLHEQLLNHSLAPIPFEQLQQYRGLNQKTAKSMVSGLQHDAGEIKLKLLELTRAVSCPSTVSHAQSPDADDATITPKKHILEQTLNDL